MTDRQERAETGVMRFGDDWPGVFIRGDNAVGYAVVLEKVLAQASRGEKLSFFDLSDLHELARQLHECDQGVGSNPQQLKDWASCVPSNVRDAALVRAGMWDAEGKYGGVGWHTQESSVIAQREERIEAIIRAVDKRAER